MSARREAENPSILSKAFIILDAFTGAHRVLTLTELTRRTGLPKSTVHRLIQRLMELDALEKHNHGYRLGIRFLRQTSSMPVDSLRQLSLSYLAKLSSWADATVHLGVLRDSYVVFLESLKTPEVRFPAGLPGSKLPARYTAIGRAIMGYMPDDILTEILQERHRPLTQHSITDDDLLRQELVNLVGDGYAVQRDEVVVGLGNIAMPVMVKQFPIAAVAVQFPASSEVSSDLINALKVTAQRIAVETRAMLADGRGELFPAAHYEHS